MSSQYPVSFRSFKVTWSSEAMFMIIFGNSNWQLDLLLGCYWNHKALWWDIMSWKNLVLGVGIMNIPSWENLSEHQGNRNLLSWKIFKAGVKGMTCHVRGWLESVYVPSLSYDWKSAGSRVDGISMLRITFLPSVTGKGCILQKIECYEKNEKNSQIRKCYSLFFILAWKIVYHHLNKSKSDDK